MDLAAAIAGWMLAVSAALSVYRMLRGPSVADRMVALDTLLFIGVGGVGVTIVRSGDTIFVPVLVVTVLTAFISTVVVGRYIEAENRNDS